MRSLTAVLTAALVLLPAAPAWAANQPPVAADDAVAYRNTGGLDYVVPALGNDSDPDGDPLTYTAVTPATKGNAYLRDGKLFYKPYLAETGTDTFTYTVSDGQGNTATGTVTATLWVDPALPADIAISSPGQGSVTLTWSAAARAAGYRVYRNRQFLASTPDLSWTDSGLSDTESYEYQIASVNGGGYEASWYYAPTVYRRAQLPSPTGLTVEVTGDATTLAVTWSAGGMLGPWNVYRDGAFVASSTTPAFQDTGLVTGREYAYQVQYAFPSTSREIFIPSALSAPVRATPVELSSIGRYFWDAGWSAGGLGPITVPERAIPGGRQQDHTRGIILQQDGDVPFSVRSGFAPVYAAAGGAAGDLGFPLADHECGYVDYGCGQHFEGGSVWSSMYTPTVVVPQVIEDGWAAIGWAEGPLGYPTAGLVVLRSGVKQAFEGGAVYWSEAGGSHGVAYPVFERWGATGYENGPLGYPTSDEVESPKGIRQSFSGGTIWSSPSGTYTVRGAIRTAWSRFGWESGLLGHPVSEEIALRNGGRLQKFRSGLVSWNPTSGVSTIRATGMRAARGRVG